MGNEMSTIFKQSSEQHSGIPRSLVPEQGNPQDPSLVLTQFEFGKLPIHERPVSPDLQIDSVFYNGRIPPEIRDEIFRYALQEYTKSDSSSLYPQNTKYTRPGYTGKRAIDISLLQTCRRIYLELYQLPVRNREHVFWHGSATGPLQPNNNPNGFRREKIYFEEFQPWQLALIKEAHFFTQMYWLERSFPLLCRKYFMQGMEKVKLTIRRSDWWWNESNTPLGINPQRGNGDIFQMERDALVVKNGGTIPWNQNGWGCAFAYLPILKELEIEFETSPDKVPELERILERAKTWRFPLGDGAYLLAEGMNVKKSTWRGPICMFSESCPYCGSIDKCVVKDPEDGNCTERGRLKVEEVGPMLSVYSLTWKRVEPGPVDPILNQIWFP